MQGVKDWDTMCLQACMQFGSVLSQVQDSNDKMVNVETMNQRQRSLGLGEASQPDTKLTVLPLRQLHSPLKAARAITVSCTDPAAP